MSLADKIVETLVAEVQKHGLELLQRYPDDLLVHDRARMKQIAGPGIKLAVCLGHSHSHILALGISKNQNELVPSLTRLSESDRFYVLSVNTASQISLVEKTREEFALLGSDRPAFSLKNGDRGFAQVLKGTEVLASVQCTVQGNMMERTFTTVYTPSRNLSANERYAVILHSEEFTTATAGTLFWRGSVCNSEDTKQAA